MPYANAGGVKIYYEVEGAGPPLVLGHGGNDSMEMWRRWRYTEVFKREYTVVLLDFRGHGQSDKPHRISDYGAKMADDVVAVLDALSIDKAHYFGYSMGATVGFTLATRQAARFHSFVLGGVTPYAWPEEMVEAVKMSVDGYKMLLTSQEDYLEWMEHLLAHPLTAVEREQYLSKDARAAVAVLTSLLKMHPLTDADLAGIRTPSLVFCGDQDPFHAGAEESVKHMPKGAFVALPGLNHISALARPDMVVRVVRAFLGIVNGD